MNFQNNNQNSSNVKTTTFKMLFQAHNLQNSNKNYVIVISSVLKLAHNFQITIKNYVIISAMSELQPSRCYFEHIT